MINPAMTPQTQERHAAVDQAQEYYRYCPGEERIKISEAICQGRRRVHYPKCPGCQFNDDEIRAKQLGQRRLGGAGAYEETVKMIESVFKAYDIRGTYPDPLDEEIAWRVGYAAATYLYGCLRGIERSGKDANTIVVGRDMRKSSPSMQKAFIEGATSAGSRIIDVGMIDTPQLYFAVNHLHACGGVQTTASHNPAQYNGFKICGQHGRPIGSDSGLADIRAIASNTQRRATPLAGTVVSADLTEEYQRFVLQFLKPPKRLRVAVDASNGMAGKWMPVVFGVVQELELITVNMETTGEFVHDPNPLVAANLEQLRDLVRRHECHFGICFDGDADRLIMVDEKADIVACDILTGLLAKYFLAQHPGATVVYDLRSSRAVKEEIRAAGGVPRRERVGHAFMKKALADSNGVFGGELSGHFYFRDNWYCDSGLLAFVHMVNLLSATDEPLSALIAPLKRYASSGEINFRNARADESIKGLEAKYRDAQVDFLDGITVQYEDWWFNVRKSNTEPLLRLNLEAADHDLMERKLGELTPLLGTRVDH